MSNIECEIGLADELIAGDEQRLDAAEAGDVALPVLRLWEARRTVAVLGRGSNAERELDLAACARQQIEVLRRSSGGCAVLLGPGCLVYSLICARPSAGPSPAIASIHEGVLRQLASALALYIDGVERQGTSDLVLRTRETATSALGGRKFSGNSLRLRRRAMLYHGTLLYDFPLAQIAQCLRHPPREPAYRAGRRHTDFLVNLPLSRDALTGLVRAAFVP